MIDVMRRHEIQVLRAAGHKVKEIAKRVGASERSVKRIAKEARVTAADERSSRAARAVGRPSTAAPFRKEAEAVLAGNPEMPTVEVLRLLREKGYVGGKSALYELVRSVRPAETRPLVRFDGVPGEFSQHDFGQVAIRYVSGKSELVHFFASRLKYSRFAHVVLVPDERVEPLVRSVIEAFDAFGGVPLVGVFDNPRTIVTFRKDRIIEWNVTFGQAALDLRFAPELCWPRRANQKGAVENLVGWVKSSFFKVRRFHDREDLARQLKEWLAEVNERRPSRATGVPPLERLKAERDRMRPLQFRPEEYALRFPIVVGPTGLVDHDGYRYSMPPRSIGIPGTLFLFPEKVRIVAGPFEAVHPRFPPEGKTSYRKEDRAMLLAAVSGDRAKLYARRQQILELGPVAEAYLTEIVHKRPRTWRGDVERLYDLLLEVGPKRLLSAMSRSADDRLFGAEHVADAVKEVAA
jgi:transposase